MSLSDPKHQDPYNGGVRKPTRFSDATVPNTPTASPLSQIRGVSAKNSTGAGIPKHVTNVAASIARASAGTTSAVTVTFSRDPSDTLHSKVNVYVRGYQGNQSPVQIASGSESPVTFVANNTGETISVLVQSQGNSGAAPLDTAPSTGIQLAKSTAGGFGTNTVTQSAPPIPVSIEYFTGPGMADPPTIYPSVYSSIVPAINNAVICTRFTMKQNITVTKITWSVQTGVAGKHVAFAIFSADGLTKLLDTGALNAAAAGLVSATVSPVTLAAGTAYWFAQTSDDATVAGPVTNATATTDRVLAVFSNTLARFGQAANSSIAGAMPGTLGVVTAITTVGSSCGIAIPLFEA